MPFNEKNPSCGEDPSKNEMGVTGGVSTYDESRSLRSAKSGNDTFIVAKTFSNCRPVRILHIRDCSVKCRNAMVLSMPDVKS